MMKTLLTLLLLAGCAWGQVPDQCWTLADKKMVKVPCDETFASAWGQGINLAKTKRRIGGTAPVCHYETSEDGTITATCPKFVWDALDYTKRQNAELSALRSELAALKKRVEELEKAQSGQPVLGDWVIDADGCVNTHSANRRKIRYCNPMTLTKPKP